MVGGRGAVLKERTIYPDIPDHKGMHDSWAVTQDHIHVGCSNDAKRASEVSQSGQPTPERRDHGMGMTPGMRDGMEEIIGLGIGDSNRCWLNE